LIGSETDRLIVRNWRQSDLGLFHEINSDNEVMEFFPFRRDREESRELMDRLAGAIDRNGYGFAALELKSTGQCIGFCGLADTGIETVFPPGTIEIGWRLARPFWGHGYVPEAGRAWLDHGFSAMNLDEIISMAVWNNRRSIAVMERLGMKRDPARDFDHPSIPDSHPHLKRHVFYSVGRDGG
jgi:RimJ/RimL family protein N-acetyltransferase